MSIHEALEVRSAWDRRGNGQWSAKPSPQPFLTLNSHTLPPHPLCFSLSHTTAAFHQADEVFTTGTAVVVCSVGSLTYKGSRRSYAKAAGQAGE